MHNAYNLETSEAAKYIWMCTHFFIWFIKDLLLIILGILSYYCQLGHAGHEISLQSIMVWKKVEK